MRARRVDSNLSEVVKAYRKLGCRVAINNDNLCDLIVQHSGVTDLVECKDGSKPPSARRLTALQEKNHAEIMIRVITGLDQVADHVAALRRKHRAICYWRE